MTRTLWNVTFERVTQESAEQGDAEERGFCGEDMCFRDALELFNSERPYGYIEADELPVRSPRSFTDYDPSGASFGDSVNVTLHIPEHITDSSRLRLARLLKCYGAT